MKGLEAQMFGQRTNHEFNGSRNAESCKMRVQKSVLAILTAARIARLLTRENLDLHGVGNSEKLQLRESWDRKDRNRERVCKCLFRLQEPV
jgi:hypothetical protein